MSVQDRKSVVAILAVDQPDPTRGRSLPISLYRVRSADQLADRLESANALVFWEFKGEWLRQTWRLGLPLEWVHVAGAGVENVLFRDLVESRVVVTNSRGVFDEPVAEYAITLVTALAKRLPETLRLQASKTWKHRQATRLAGSRLLVVGIGGIGRAVAAKGAALGMHVTGVGRVARSVDPATFQRVHGVGDLQLLVGQADHVVLAVPLTTRTKGMLDLETLKAFRGATLVNVARGPVIEDEALLWALDKGLVSAAALDVFGTEPLPSASRLWSHPRVVVSPHMSGDVAGIEQALLTLWLDNLELWLKGLPLRNVVDKSLGFVPSQG